MRPQNTNLRQLEYEVILELSGEFPVRLLCESMGIRRSSFYYWKKRLSDPAPKTKALADSVVLFREYHLKYPPHGYRRLKAKIKLDIADTKSPASPARCTRTLFLQD